MGKLSKGGMVMEYQFVTSFWLFVLRSLFGIMEAPPKLRATAVAG